MSELEFPPGTPDEIQSFVTNRVTKQQMEASAFRHQVIRFFDELTLEQCQQITWLLNVVGGDEATAEYFRGYLVALMDSKFNICAGCGINHDEELLGPVDPEEQAKARHPSRTSRTPAEKAHQPWDDQGNRLASCLSCNGDKYFKVCTHRPGTHGQGGRENCPEPLHVPCPDCCTPEWFKEDLLSPCGKCGTGTLLPLPTPGLLICADCGAEVVDTNP